ncbi:MAG: hypothetical protein R3224_07170, partial [Balneolaceae bacterium]|nr:hypothetical protein [Balneolaceae bacterium]
DLDNRISALLKAVTNWLNKENDYLSVAVEQTVREEYFSLEDIGYALRSLKKNLNETAVRRWIERSGLSDQCNAEGENVLCLHAGNLPLVGFQDAFATLLSGATYYGKISRKDPYLLPTFLNEVKKTDHFSGIDLQWVHNLDDLEGLQSHSILFAGSEESVPGVKQAIERLDLATGRTRYLIRTAHFSMAYLDSRDERHMKELVEAIFRYGGKGCRSVAVVVSPWPLDVVKCELTDYVEAFWLENPQHAKPKPKLAYRFAYNRSIERPQAWLDDFLLQEDGLELDQDFICYWVPGDGDRAAKLANRFGSRLQGIYVTHPDMEIPGYAERTEYLSDAQNPPLYWKPDGIDTVEWLIRK